MIYCKGRTNLSCTIFVPYDCDNNCPFCTSKSDYIDCSSFNLEKIIKMIGYMNSNPVIEEFVITGGEPFANLESLKRIVAACKKTVYINTTLPHTADINEVIRFINDTKNIGGINISRHVGLEFSGVCDIEIIDRINKPIRINTVINKNFSFERFLEFVKLYGKKKRDINLRADYRYVTFESLKSRDKFSCILQGCFDYISSESCIVCNSEYYSVNDKFIVAYHRGMEHSSIIVGNKCYVNDILIKQDGNVYRDWDCPDDKEFLQWILYPLTKPNFLYLKKARNLGEAIKEVRLAQGITQKDLGLTLGFSEKTADVRIAQYEAGQRNPKDELLQKIQEALNCVFYPKTYVEYIMFK